MLCTDGSENTASSILPLPTASQMMTKPSCEASRITPALCSVSLGTLQIPSVELLAPLVLRNRLKEQLCPAGGSYPWAVPMAVASRASAQLHVLPSQLSQGFPPSWEEPDSPAIVMLTGPPQHLQAEGGLWALYTVTQSMALSQRGWECCPTSSRLAIPASPLG